MNIVPTNTDFDFFGKRRGGYIFSVLLMVLALGSLAVKGLNFGLDFTGGVLIEAGYEEAADLPAIREVLSSSGIDDAVVQYFGSSTSVMVRLPPIADENQSEVSGRVLAALQVQDPDVQMRRVEYVGPAVGKELIEAGGLAVIFVLAGILIYVGFRFELRLAAGAIVALIHDLVIVLGIVSLFQIEFNLTVLAAFLALAGYSINDTIVIFDRIRETFQKMRKGTEQQVMNIAINSTLARTVVTSGTTMLTLAALLVFGGEALFGFALVLLIGVVLGTYSSVFVASAASLDMGLRRTDLLKIEDKEAVDDRP
ncbi:MAG: protein translocase subunit SecF [Halothiobacillaceae bacterium]